MVEIVNTHKWTTDGWPLLSLSIRAEELATRLSLTLETWRVEGLGLARGFGFRGPSGRVYHLQELELAVLHQGALGPAVLVDATDLTSIPIETLVADVLVALDLSEADLAEVANPAEISIAKEFLSDISVATDKTVGFAGQQPGARTGAES